MRPLGLFRGSNHVRMCKKKSMLHSTNFYIPPSVCCEKNYFRVGRRVFTLPGPV